MHALALGGQVAEGLVEGGQFPFGDVGAGAGLDEQVAVVLLGAGMQVVHLAEGAARLVLASVADPGGAFEAGAFLFDKGPAPLVAQAAVVAGAVAVVEAVGADAVALALHAEGATVGDAAVGALFAGGAAGADFAHDGADRTGEGLGDGVGGLAGAQAVFDLETFLFGEAGFVHGVFLWLAGGGIAAGLARKLPVMEAGVSKSKCSLPHGGGGDVRSPPHRSPSPPSLPVRFGSTRCSLRLAPPLVQLVAPRVGAFTLASDTYGLL